MRAPNVPSRTVRGRRGRFPSLFPPNGTLDAVWLVEVAAELVEFLAVFLAYAHRLLSDPMLQTPAMIETHVTSPEEEVVASACA
jgi:hypothetical protein